MSVKVRSIGDKILIPNPAKPGEQTWMQNVVFIEEGRESANKGLSESSKALDRALAAFLGEGETSGLVSSRIHTQPMNPDLVSRLQIGMELPNLHINRELHSIPQMRNQVDKDARMVDGLPTYFVTVLSDKIVDDLDKRLPLKDLVNFSPAEIYKATPGATTTYRTDANGENGRYVGPGQSNISADSTATPTANREAATTNGAPANNAAEQRAAV